MAFYWNPRTIQIEPTRKCNLSCKICLRKGLEDLGSTLSLDQFKKILEFGNFTYAGLHGWGEPMLNPDLFKMIAYAEAKRIRTSLTTNGTLIGSRIDMILSSGLHEIAFGVFQKDLFHSVYSNIADLVRKRNEAGLKYPVIYLDITVHNENVDQIPEFIKDAAKLKVDAIILHRLFHSHLTGSGLQYISEKSEKALLIKALKQTKALKLKAYLPPKHSKPCQIVKRSLYVSAKGDVTPCCFLPTTIMGTAFAANKKSLLKSMQYKNFLKTMEKHSVCSQCVSW